MIYLAVDKDGTEKISNSLLFRRKGSLGKIKSICWGLMDTIYSKNNYNKWANCWSTIVTDTLPFDGVILPKGTIEKIIGKKLTWKDEQVEIN